MPVPVRNHPLLPLLPPVPNTLPSPPTSHRPLGPRPTVGGPGPPAPVPHVHRLVALDVMCGERVRQCHGAPDTWHGDADVCHVYGTSAGRRGCDVRGAGTARTWQGVNDTCHQHAQCAAWPVGIGMATPSVAVGATHVEGTRTCLQHGPVPRVKGTRTCLQHGPVPRVRLAHAATCQGYTHVSSAWASARVSTLVMRVDRLDVYRVTVYVQGMRSGITRTGCTPLLRAPYAPGLGSPGLHGIMCWRGWNGHQLTPCEYSRSGARAQDIQVETAWRCCGHFAPVAAQLKGTTEPRV